MNHFIKILGVCGACIAFYIGAGFATMQEVMQYEASYGSRFFVVIIIAALIYVYTNFSFISNGYRKKIKNGCDIYKLYCGKNIGKFYEYFSAFFCYMCFIVMCGGANSTAMEQWGLPNGAGAVILALLSVLVVLMGLNGILKNLKILGPIIIFAILIIALWTSITGWYNFPSGLKKVDAHVYDIMQVGNGNPLASGASYGGFVILWFAAFLAELGGKSNIKIVNWGMVLSTFAIFGVATICCVALISNIDATWNVGVPALKLASQIHPAFAETFTFIIFIGIFTSAVPLLWTGVRKVSNEGTSLYKRITIVGGGVGCIVACCIPYKGLLNVLYGLNGYLGFVLIAFMIVNDIRFFIMKKNK